MSHTNKTFLILGGDKRNIYISRQLADTGNTVHTLLLPDGEPHKNITHINNIKNCSKHYDCIIGPVPISVDGTHIYSPLTEEKYSINVVKELTSRAPYILCGGVNRISRLFNPGGISVQSSCVNVNNCEIVDIVNNDETAILNSIAVAEGIIKDILTYSDKTIHSSNTLILGYGRCGKTIADRLRALNSHVTVASDSDYELASARIYNVAAVPLRSLTDVSLYDFIINTIPTLVITPTLLDTTSDDVLILDIASGSGGTDFEYAKKLKREAHLCPSIPGRTGSLYASKVLLSQITRYM